MTPHLTLDVVTIFPEYLAPLSVSLLGKAQDRGVVSVGIHNLRDHAHDVHRTVDDSPCGGGPGMVMKPDIWGAALDEILDPALAASPCSAPGNITAEPGGQRWVGTSRDGASSDGEPREGRHGHAALWAETPHVDSDTADGPLVVVPGPAGAPFTQETARRWAAERHLIFACGRYEGIDQRVIDYAATRTRVEEVSLGDYVLIGGEVAVLVMVEAVVRLIPGVLGNHRSHEEDSFSDGLLEGPCYTRPIDWRGRTVPDVLLSGHHAKIDRWRRDQSLARTAARRPELIEQVDLSAKDRAALDSLGW